MLLPIITGTCGTQKMSKSLGNYIGILDEPFDKFGKVMSIPDELMPEYFKYTSGLSPESVNKLLGDLESGNLHPNEAKKELACKVVAFFHGEEIGRQMREQFENVFKKKSVPDDIPSKSLSDEVTLLDLLVESSLVSSKKDGRRMVDQGAVSIVDGDKFSDPLTAINNSFDQKVLKVGKRKFLKLDFS